MMSVTPQWWCISAVHNIIVACAEAGGLVVVVKEWRMALGDRTKQTDSQKWQTIESGVGKGVVNHSYAWSLLY